MIIAIIIIFSFLLLSIYLGIRARKGRDMDLEQGTVGGRGFGPHFEDFFFHKREIWTPRKGGIAQSITGQELDCSG